MEPIATAALTPPEALHAVRRQFLGNCPHHLFAWLGTVAGFEGTADPWVTPELQAAVAADVLQWAADRDVMPCAEYTGTFLRLYMRRIEAAFEEVDEQLVMFRCEAASVVPDPDAPWERGPDFTLKTWFTSLTGSPDSYVSTMEHKRTISGGTTGLKSWPASLALAEYLLRHPSLVRGQHVVELGSGAGMLGLVLASPAVGARRVTLTDVHGDVLRLLAANVKRFQSSTTDAPAMDVACVDWFTATSADPVPASVPDVVLCADTAYDPDLLPGLTSCLAAFFGASAAAPAKDPVVYLATAVRRDSTYAALGEHLRSRGMKYAVECAELGGSGWFPPDEVGAPIALLRVERA
ncbi:hypothetical protein H9P43_003044 [Blastocladiella emersonii ATCC 22665]|nr:hypothetical protein H9P43_003044 [Blastocladiella emersonii ATCC 22665]